MSGDFSTCDNCCDPTGNQPLTLCDACNEGPDEDRIRDAALERAAQRFEGCWSRLTGKEIAAAIRALKGGGQ